MKKKLCALISVALLSSSAYAYKQTVKVCAHVNSFQSPFQFRVIAESSDFFDRGFKTDLISNGQRCASHQYKKGPKNMTFTVQPLDWNSSYKNLEIENVNCDMKVSYFRDGYISKKRRMNGENVQVDIHIDQVSAKGKYIYKLTCAYQ